MVSLPSDHLSRPTIDEQLRGTGVLAERFSSMEKQHGIVQDDKAQEQPADKKRAEQPSQTTDKEKLPAAGPHAKPELTDNSKTPGAGALPDPGTNQESTSG